MVADTRYLQTSYSCFRIFFVVGGGGGDGGERAGRRCVSKMLLIELMASTEKAEVQTQRCSVVRCADVSMHIYGCLNWRSHSDYRNPNRKYCTRIVDYPFSVTTNLSPLIPFK